MEFYFVRCADARRSAGLLNSSGLGAVLLDAKYAPCERVLEAAFLLSKAAFLEGGNISSSLPNEILLFLSGQTHVSKAILKAGAKSGEKSVLFVYGRGGKIDFAKLGMEEIGGEFSAMGEERIKSEIERMALSRA